MIPHKNPNYLVDIAFKTQEIFKTQRKLKVFLKLKTKIARCFAKTQDFGNTTIQRSPKKFYFPSNKDIVFSFSERSSRQDPHWRGESERHHRSSDVPATRSNRKRHHSRSPPPSQSSKRRVAPPPPPGLLHLTGQVNLLRKLNPLVFPC